MIAPVPARRLISVVPDPRKYGGCKTCRSADFSRIPPAGRPAVALDLYRIVIEESNDPEDICNLAHLMGAILAGDGYDVWCPAHDPCLDIARVLTEYRERRD